MCCLLASVLASLYHATLAHLHYTPLTQYRRACRREAIHTSTFTTIITTTTTIITTSAITPACANDSGTNCTYASTRARTRIGFHAVGIGLSQRVGAEQ